MSMSLKIFNQRLFKHVSSTSSIHFRHPRETHSAVKLNVFNKNEYGNSDERPRGCTRRWLLFGGAAAVTSAAVATEEKRELEDQEYEVDQADTTRFRKTRMFQHFSSYASTKYNNEVYMNANDFFDAIIRRSPSKTNLRELTEEEFTRILDSTPGKSEEGGCFLRVLPDNVLISYPEFLFLASLVSTPKDNFLRTFQIIDVDGNWLLEKEEFEALEAIFSNGISDISSENTTLKVHFFDHDGKGVITFKEFSNFLDGLQEECLKVEYEGFSKGSHGISSHDFARILLSRTDLKGSVAAKYIDRISPEDNTRISFEQFSQFMRLLNDIHDLDIALRMFQVAKKPVTPEEFQRAVKVCTGAPLDDRMVELTFKIFDEDGDGHLSHKEFVKIMKNRRVKQGTVDTQVPANSWKAFTKCVHRHMKQD